MSTITQALYTARDGVLAMQSALGTVAENVSNVNTPGYSRKIQSFETRVLDGVGAGVQLGPIQRAIDEGLIRDQREESMTLGMLSVQSDFYERVEALFGSPGDNTSISHSLNDLTTKLEALSASPNRSVEQGDFVTSAVSALDKLSNMSDELQELRQQADVDIEQAVSQVNSELQVVADLNAKIIRNDAIGNDTSSLKDRRDQALNTLSELIDIQYFERNTGEVAVFTSSGRALVDNDAVGISHEAASGVSPFTSHEGGGFTGIFVETGRSSTDITDEIRLGKLKGLLDIRDGVLNDVQRQIDELANTLKETVNQVHNSATPAGGRDSMEGTRSFVQSPAPASTYDQTIQITGQVRFVLTDDNGDQITTTTFDNANMMGSNGPHTVQDVADNLQTWIRAQGYSTATVGFNDQGKLDINLNDDNVNLSIFDENPSVLGEYQAAEITFDATAQGLGNENIQGFSNFFGLNDFFVDTGVRSEWESGLLSENTTLNGGTLTFHDETSGVGAGNEIGSITINPNWTVEELAEAINSDPVLRDRISASAVSEGNGVRLRINHARGEELIIGSNQQSTLNSIGFRPSTLAKSQAISVREDILSSPGLVSTARMHFDTTVGAAGGEYRILDGDNSGILALSDAFKEPQAFLAAGGSVNRMQSIADYSTNIIGTIANQKQTLDAQTNSQQRLVDSLTAKSDNIKGVNLDEEMSQLIVFEQAYSAAARVMSTIQEMFDTLENAL